MRAVHKVQSELHKLRRWLLDLIRLSMPFYTVVQGRFIARANQKISFAFRRPDQRQDRRRFLFHTRENLLQGTTTKTIQSNTDMNRNLIHQNHMAIYEDQSRMIDWVHLALDSLPLAKEQKNSARQIVTQLEKDRPEELYQRARKAMSQMFEVGQSGNPQRVFVQSVLGADAKQLQIV